MGDEDITRCTNYLKGDRSQAFAGYLLVHPGAMHRRGPSSGRTPFPVAAQLVQDVMEI